MAETEKKRRWDSTGGETKKAKTSEWEESEDKKGIRDVEKPKKNRWDETPNAAADEKKANSWDETPGLVLSES